MKNLQLSFRRSPLTANEIILRIWRYLHIDFLLLIGILLLMFTGLFILYSATNQSIFAISHQLGSFALAFLVMLFIAQIPPHRYQVWAPWLYGVVVILLIVVLGIGVISKGGQRWLNFGILRFQPSEIMKLAMPLMLSWYLKDKILPLRPLVFLNSCFIILIPVLLVAKQPDLSTAILIACTGIFVVVLAGITWKLFISMAGTVAIAAPIIWHFLHAYQKNRLLVFFSPERDPLNSGYNIIQSKIAIGSGGLFGKGWLHGSQAHLQFLPEHATDFIFAVCGEEFGLFGCAILIGIFLYLVLRALYISSNAQDTFSRLLTGSLALTFFASFFINIGMVSGLLPVVGLPLPLISYGGSSIVSLFAGFGLIMSVRTHRRLIGS
ncbi:MAG: rod shape-determining protein RodA [Gammaproteobacteria bacterium]|nr:rod shape-determining protein RodA [Gammaproteobacteria bacterium]